MSVLDGSLRLMETKTTRQVLVGGHADGATFDDLPIPQTFVAAVHFDSDDFELCGCGSSADEPVRAPYRLDRALSRAMGCWAYVPDKDDHDSSHH